MGSLQAQPFLVNKQEPAMEEKKSARTPNCRLSAGSCSEASKELISSPRESLLSEAWERKRGHMNCRSCTTTSMKPRKRMSRSVSHSSGLAASCTDRGRSLRTSLTDDDFEELKGCIELGFAFQESSIPELSHILPALHACYAVTCSFHPEPSHVASPPHSPSSWKVSNPGDDPDDVKERLRHWAQAVACNLRLY